MVIRQRGQVLAVGFFVRCIHRLENLRNKIFENDVLDFLSMQLFVVNPAHPLVQALWIIFRGQLPDLIH